MSCLDLETSTALSQGASPTARAAVTELDGRTVSWFRVADGPRRGAIGPAEGDVLVRAVGLATSCGIPLVGELATSGADIRHGLSSLHAWGRLAAALANASGSVPVMLVVTGPCLSGPSLLLGLADHVVMTADAYAYVTGPRAVAEFTGLETDHRFLGGAQVHDGATGVASMVVASADDALDVVADLLAHLPDNNLALPPAVGCDDPPGRPTAAAASTVPAQATASYDVRHVVADVLDAGSFLEVRARHADNVVTGYGRVAGRPVGVVANQPCRLAGTLDIDASRKAARFVTTCDAFNVPLVTFVDTPGFQPGKELEWRGIIRHGAGLVHAYAEATTPRVSIILRKAYGGAYIVMDSRGLGNDVCLAWPTAEIAVMGADAAVGVVNRQELASFGDDAAREGHRAQLELDYVSRHLTPDAALARGYVDEVIDPVATRAHLTRALSRLSTKREHLPRRKHSNTPL